MIDWWPEYENERILKTKRTKKKMGADRTIGTRSDQGQEKTVTNWEKQKKKKKNKE